METQGRTPKGRLSDAIDQICNAEPRQIEVEEAGSRVWARVSERTPADVPPDAVGISGSSALRNCTDYQSLIPDFQAGRLAGARALLLEDHLRECLTCRRSLAPEERNVQRHPVPGAHGFKTRWVLSGLAAAIVLLLAAAQTGLVRQLLFPVEVSAEVDSLRGQLFHVTGSGLEVLEAGARIGPGQAIRTGRDSGTIVELADGSRVEMRERSELSFVPARDGVRIALDRGSVIVRAAGQESGHLYLSTDDIDVSVVGTVFSVTAGAKGSRVSVIEGEVRVEHGSLVESLLAGAQYNGSGALTPVPVEEEIVWSQEAETHLALLAQLSRMRGELEDALRSPGLRYASSLIDLAPENTVVYAAFPNIGLALTDAYDVFTQRIQENPVTANWWNESVAASAAAGGPTLDDMIEHVRAVSGVLGNEVVITIGQSETPLFLAEVLDEDAVASRIEDVSVDLEPIQVVRSLAELQAYAGTAEPIVYVDDGLLVLSPVVEDVIGVVSSREAGTGFSSGEFYQSVTAAYGDGVDWLFAVDLASLAADASEVPDFLGFQSLKDLVVDHKMLADQTTTRVVMNFDTAAGGPASWIEAPGPMGALDFVSPDPFGVVAGLSRDPALILAEMLAELQDQSPEAQAAILAFEQEHGIELEFDLAEPLGGEFLVAIDGPLLPEPSWKLVAEVYDSARLQNAIERIIVAANSYAAIEGGPSLEIAAESVGGRIFHTLRNPDSGEEIHYTYSSGYLIAAPMRVLVTEALQYRDTTYSLGTSTAFRDLFPSGGANDCSAILYQNMTTLASSLASFVELTGVQDLAAIEEFILETPPTVTCIAADGGRIEAWNQGELAFNLVTLGGLSALMDAVGQVSQ